jgi:uncharacterized protein YjiS (DUF1127 family)
MTAMTTTELTPARPESTAERLLHLAGAAIARIAAVFAAIRNRRTVMRMLEFDDRMLSDIGLTRGDVHASLAAPIDDDPSRRLTGYWQERRSAARASARQRLRPPRRMKI